jgi:hypothetical protein
MAGRRRVDQQAMTTSPAPLLLATLLLGAACSSADGPVTASTDRRRNVMVIDEGFDTTAADLQGKVVATYKIECAARDSAAAVGGDGGTATLQDEKQQYMAELAVQDESCHLREGVDPKPDPLANVSRFRERWNSMLLQQRTGAQVFTAAEWSQLTAALDPELQTFSYHGTATSGTVAHDNPDVRLVLVEMGLGNAEQTAQGFACIAQSDIDMAAALLADPDVMSAYVHAPPSSYDVELENATRTFEIGVLSESFGTPPRVVIEKLQADAGCPPVDLGPYFAALGAADRTRAATLGGPGVLLVHSAGNEATQIDGPADSLDCAPGDLRHLLVGSDDVRQARSTFTNVGACVDVYAPGEQIIAPYAGGWLLPVQGTSFSGRMVAPVVSRAGGPWFDRTAARDALLAQRSADASIPMAAFPRDFFYVPGVPPGVPLGRIEALPSPARRALPSPVDMRRALAPLRRLQRRPQGQPSASL